MDNKEKVGLVYHSDYLIHTQSQHPERKERLEHILAVLDESNMTSNIRMIEPVSAGVEEIAMIHDASYIRSVEEACKSGKSYLDMDTYIVPDSYRIALLSAGGALTGMRRVVEDKSGKVFVLNRPPGHHAERSRAMGFCLFNNVAVAAEAARREYNMQRIAIVDWDVHHGNGTQHSFEKDPGILFISTHQSPAYPGTGSMHEVGTDKGVGFTVNIPLPAGCGDAEYALFFDNVIIPIIDEYKPELLIISAGHDAYHRDPLANMSLTHSGYYYMAEVLTAAAERYTGGKILLCLEGGYHLQGQAGAVLHVLNALGKWGLPVDERSPDLQPGRHIQQRLEEVMDIHKQYWNI